MISFIGEIRVAVFLAMKLKVFSPPRQPFIVYLPFVCRHCGKCCRKLGTTWKASDIKRAATYLEISPRTFVEEYLGHTLDTMDKEVLFKYEIDSTKTQPCPFLTANNECTIYPVRPYGCQMYPLLNEGGARITCPAYEHLKDAITIMTQGSLMMKQPIVTGTSLCPISAPEDLKMRETIEWSKQRIWETYLQTKPNEQEKNLFKRWNFKTRKQKPEQTTLFH